MRRLIAAALLLALTAPALAQDAARRPAPRKGGPWFDVTLPPKASSAPAVKVGARPPRPATAGAADPEFNGAAIKADVASIVGFARAAGTSKEIGSGQMWGRIAGFPSSDKTVEWALDQFRKAGITDVRTQSIAQDQKSSLWLPLSWKVTLLGDPAFGAGSNDIVLESALPVGPSAIQGGTMTAPLVYVGAASPAVLQHIDVKGKIAVQLIVPQGHMLFERGAVDSRSEELVKRGAVGVFNLVRLPGNELSRDFTDCGNPCFNIGGRDGLFLESILDRAAQAGVTDQVRVRIDLETQTYRNLKANNGVGVIRGTTDEVIVLNAHVDGWFDGAGDNGDGLAVLIALARHFARPANKPQRTIAFVASAGHHTPGINGPRSFVAANPDLAKRAVMFVNIEHVAQRNFSPARTTAADGYREAVADSGEAPIAVGVTNNSPYLQELIDAGPARFGVNFISERSTFQSGETGGWAALNVAKVSVMQAPPLYHTTGEVLDVISAPGLERIARLLAFLMSAADQAPRERIESVKRISVLGILIAAGALTVAVAAREQQPPPQPSVDNLTVEKVKDNLFVLRGGGGNVAVFVTAKGVTLVDSKNPGWGQPLLDKVKTLTDKPVTMVINTHLHFDHVSGNVSMPAATEIVAHAYTAKNIAAPGTLAGTTTPPPNVFKENPGKGIPKRTFTDTLTIGSGADRIDLYHFGRAHTGGDAFVAFPAHRIMHVGDTYPSNGLPIMDRSNGGSGVEYANTIRKAVKGVPNIDSIINGHTPANTTPADMLRFADFVSDFVAYVQAGKTAGKSAEQLAKEWATPAKYTGFANPPAIERLTSYVTLIFEETK